MDLCSARPVERRRRGGLTEDPEVVGCEGSLWSRTGMGTGRWRHARLSALSPQWSDQAGHRCMKERKPSDRGGEESA